MMQLILTSSEMKLWQNCQRGWWLKYWRQLTRNDGVGSLPDIGSMYHSALEAYYAGRTDSPAELIAVRAAQLAEVYPEQTRQFLLDGEIAAIMAAGYLDWLEETGIDSGFEVIGAEQQVEVEVGAYLLRGKIDARVRRLADGALLQLEHKTTADLVTIPRYAQTDLQFLTYDLLAYMTKPDGVPTDGVLIRMARRVKRTPKAKPPFYAEHPVLHSIDELRAHYKHVVGIGVQIERTRMALGEGGDFQLICPPSSGRTHLYSCPCAELSALPDDGSDLEAFLEEFYVHEDPLARYGGGA